MDRNRSGTRQQIVIAGAGYAGLHVTLRLAAWDDRHRAAVVTLVDQHPYHQAITELPRVAAGTRAAQAVRVPLAQVLEQSVTFVQARVSGFDLAARRLLTEAGPLPYTRLVLALGSRPNDFGIPGLRERALSVYSVDDAEHVWAAVNAAMQDAAGESDRQRQRRLLTAVIGGAGAVGVELAGALAEEMPALARRHGLSPDLPRVVLVEAGPTILVGSSPDLIARATRILGELGVIVRTNAMIAAATGAGIRLIGGDVIEGSVFVWAGGLKAPELVYGSALPIGYNGRIKVDQYLRALGHPEIFVAGDLASVVDPQTGHALPPLAQIALEEGETVAHNLEAEITGQPLEPFRFRNKGFVVSVGDQRGVADVAGHTIGGRLAHTLKDAIEWEYRQSVKHLHGWSPV